MKSQLMLGQGEKKIELGTLNSSAGDRSRRQLPAAGMEVTQELRGGARYAC